MRATKLFISIKNHLQLVVVAVAVAVVVVVCECLPAYQISTFGDGVTGLRDWG